MVAILKIDFRILLGNFFVCSMFSNGELAISAMAAILKIELFFILTKPLVR